MSPYAPFWMVYGVGQDSPKARHKTRDSALAEAKRLARTNIGIEFFVLEATHHVVKRDVDVTLVDPDFADVSPSRNADDGIPF